MAVRYKVRVQRLNRLDISVLGDLDEVIPLDPQLLHISGWPSTCIRTHLSAIRDLKVLRIQRQLDLQQHEESSILGHAPAR